jgi:YVTN family beta-propeller protein
MPYKQSITQKLSEPFLGPRSFTSREKDIFFGRDAETQKIVSLILSNQETLIYAQSGAGKTSIINAKVLPELETYEMQILPTTRVGGMIETAASQANIKNIYVFNTLQYIDPGTDPSLRATGNITEFLAKYPRKKTLDNREPPRIIIFDQFEELFTTYVKNWPNQREEFFEQLRDAINADPLLKVVFVIREEYLAQLEKYSSILPDRLRTRFHLELLRRDAAMSAVEGPLSKFDHGEVANHIAKKIVDDLLKTQVEDVFGTVVETAGEYVEPVHLQVVCQRLWHTGLPVDQKSISDTALGDVNEALEEFYADAVKVVAAKTEVDEGIIRKSCEKKLITSSGTRAFVHRGAIAEFISAQSKSIKEEKIDSIISILEQKYLIRAEWRSGAKWYELTHDRLISPLKASNLKWNDHERKKKIKHLRIVMIPAVVAIAIATSMIIFTYMNPFAISEDILLGLTPTYIAVNPNTNMIYVSNSNNDSVSIIDGKTNKVVDTIGIETPTYIAVNPNTNRIYVDGYNPDSGSASISVIDAKTKKVVDSIGIETPSYIAVNPNTNMIYISDHSNDSLSVIDGKTNKVVDYIAFMNQSTEYFAVNPNTNMIYISDYNNNSLSVIDGKTNKVVDSVGIETPSYLTVNPNSNVIYVTAAAYNPEFTSYSIDIIDGKTNKVVDAIGMKEQSEIAVNPNTNRLYARGSDSISVIDGNTKEGIVDIPLDINILHLSVNPNTNMLYVSDFDSNYVYVINGIANRIDAVVPGPEPPTLKVGKGINDLSFNPGTNMIYVAASDSNSISVIDGKTNKVVDTIRVAKPTDISVNPHTNLIYVTSYNFSSRSSTITVIDAKTNKVVDGILLQSQNGQFMAINPKSNRIYVDEYNPDSGSNSITVIDAKTKKVVDKIGLRFVSEIAVNSNTNMVYVSNYDNDSVSVIDGKTDKVVDTFKAQGASEMAVNENTNLIYVPNRDNSSVFVIDGKTNNPVGDIVVNQSAEYVTVNPITNKVYVSGYLYNPYLGTNSGLIDIIDGKTNSVEKEVALTHVADTVEIVINPNTNMIYAGSFSSNSVTVTDSELNIIPTNQD